MTKQASAMDTKKKSRYATILQSAVQKHRQKLISRSEGLTRKMESHWCSVRQLFVRCSENKDVEETLLEPAWGSEHIVPETEEEGHELAILQTDTR